MKSVVSNRGLFSSAFLAISSGKNHKLSAQWNFRYAAECKHRYVRHAVYGSN